MQVACSNSDDGNKALREAKILEGIDHTNIVAYVDVFLNMDQGLLQVCTVMEFCENGDLAQYLGKTKASGECVKCRKAWVASGERGYLCFGFSYDSPYQAGNRIEDGRAANWMYQLTGAALFCNQRHASFQHA